MKLKYKKYFVHGFDENNISFNKEVFSEFKYGNTCNALDMAQEMFNYFKTKVIIDNPKNDIVLYSSPYDKIPTSSLFLTKYLFELLKNEFPNINFKLDKIDRINTYSADYGLMSAQERFDLIANDTYSFNEKPNKNALLIFIDDISITGTHQIVIEKLIENLNIKNDIVFFYYAKLTDGSNPKIESQLNSSKIKSGEDLINLMKSNCFQFTTRTIKYILNFNNLEFKSFVKMLQDNNLDLIDDLIKLAKSNKYDEIDTYKENLKDLINLQKKGNA
jgi:hypothetical protein